jgi:ATP-dependent Clp protease ATP-binding subunit ClpA
VYERFTDRGRRVLVLAQDEARLLGHSFIGTEHLLLGLVKDEEGIAGKVLHSSGISLEGVRWKVEETLGAPGSPPSGSPPFTPRAKKVLELSLREALQLGHDYVGTEHLLLGLLREGEGVAVQVLVSLGADLGAVRQKVLDMLPEDARTAEAELSTGSRLSYGRRVQRSVQLRRAFPPVVMLVSAGVVGLAAGLAASRLSLRGLTGRLAEVEARLDRLVDAASSTTHDRRRGVR